MDGQPGQLRGRGPRFRAFGTGAAMTGMKASRRRHGGFGLRRLGNPPPQPDRRVRRAAMKSIRPSGSVAYPAALALPRREPRSRGRTARAIPPECGSRQQDDASRTTRSTKRTKTHGRSSTRKRKGNRDSAIKPLRRGHSARGAARESGKDPGATWTSRTRKRTARVSAGLANS